MAGTCEQIGARTKLLGLFGHPVGHSLSPRIHNAALRAQSLDFVYLAFDVPPDRLASAVSGLRALDVRGVNLTVPHKETVLGLLDEVDEAALRVGAVNTIVNDNGLLRGHNTDISGFRAALRSVLPHGLGGRDCLVLGAGGAARAVLAALLQEETGVILVHNRTPERAMSLCSAAAAWGTGECRPVPGPALAAAARAVHVVVNATPFGLEGPVKDFPVPVDTFHSGQVVVDLVYGADPTDLVIAARERGATAIDGKEMLVTQAASSYRLWMGREPPVDVMRGSVKLGER